MDIIVPALNLVLPALNIIGELHPALAVLRSMYTEFNNIRLNKAKCRGVVLRATEVLKVINERLSESEDRKSEDKLHIQSLLSDFTEIRDTLMKLAGMDYLKSLLRSNEVEEAISHAHHRLTDISQTFLITANIAVQYTLEDSEKARKEDVLRMEAILLDLQSNDAKILHVLNLNHQQQAEAMSAMRRVIVRDLDETIERKLMRLGVQALQKSTGLKPPATLPSWHITSYDLDIDQHSNLGEGGFGTVKRGLWNNLPVAVKIMAPGTSPELLLREINIWKGLSHNHVLQFFGASDTANPPFIVCRLMKNGNAIAYLRTHPLANRVLLVYQVSLGMEYLHHLSIVHGDLKGANILIDDAGNACVADFGLSKIKYDVFSRAHSVGPLQGTLRFMAPEQMNGALTKATDVYNYGVLIYELFTGYPPFLLVPDMAVMYLITKEHKRLEQPQEEEILQRGLTNQMWDVVWHCTSPMPEDRPTFARASKITQGLAQSWEEAHVKIASNETIALPVVQTSNAQKSKLPKISKASKKPPITKAIGKGAPKATRPAKKSTAKAGRTRAAPGADSLWVEVEDEDDYIAEDDSPAAGATLDSQPSGPVIAVGMLNPLDQPAQTGVVQVDVVVPTDITQGVTSVSDAEDITPLIQETPSQPKPDIATLPAIEVTSPTPAFLAPLTFETFDFSSAFLETSPWADEKSNASAEAPTHDLANFISKTGGASQENDPSGYWAQGEKGHPQDADIDLASVHNLEPKMPDSPTLITTEGSSPAPTDGGASIHLSAQAVPPAVGGLVSFDESQNLPPTSSVPKPMENQITSNPITSEAKQHEPTSAAIPGAVLRKRSDAEEPSSPAPLASASRSVAVVESNSPGKGIPSPAAVPGYTAAVLVPPSSRSTVMSAPAIGSSDGALSNSFVRDTELSSKPDSSEQVDSHRINPSESGRTGSEPESSGPPVIAAAKHGSPHEVPLSVPPASPPLVVVPGSSPKSEEGSAAISFLGPFEEPKEEERTRPLPSLSALSKDDSGTERYNDNRLGVADRSAAPSSQFRAPAPLQSFTETYQQDSQATLIGSYDNSLFGQVMSNNKTEGHSSRSNVVLSDAPATETVPFREHDNALPVSPRDEASFPWLHPSYPRAPYPKDPSERGTTLNDPQSKDSFIPFIEDVYNAGTPAAAEDSVVQSEPRSSGSLPSFGFEEDSESPWSNMTSRRAQDVKEYSFSGPVTESEHDTGPEAATPRPTSSVPLSYDALNQRASEMSNAESESPVSATSVPLVFTLLDVGSLPELNAASPPVRPHASAQSSYEPPELRNFPSHASAHSSFAPPELRHLTSDKAESASPHQTAAVPLHSEATAIDVAPSGSMAGSAAVRPHAPVHPSHSTPDVHSPPRSRAGSTTPGRQGSAPPSYATAVSTNADVETPPSQAEVELLPQVAGLPVHSMPNQEQSRSTKPDSASPLWSIQLKSVSATGFQFRNPNHSSRISISLAFERQKRSHHLAEKALFERRRFLPSREIEQIDWDEAYTFSSVPYGSPLTVTLERRYGVDSIGDMHSRDFAMWDMFEEGHKDWPRVPEQTELQCTFNVKFSVAVLAIGLAFCRNRAE